MKEFRLGRSEHRDPTDNQAVAKADRPTFGNNRHNRPPGLHTLNGYHATLQDMARYTGVTFEPDRQISDRQLRRLQWDLRNRP